MYKHWSAIVTVQELSQHHQDPTQLKEYLGQGETLVFKYTTCPRRKPSENSRTAQFRFVTDVYKLMTRETMPKKREDGDLSPEGLVQVINDVDRIPRETG